MEGYAVLAPNWDWASIIVALLVGMLMSCLDIRLGRETIYHECLEFAWAARVLLVPNDGFSSDKHGLHLTRM